MRLLSDLHETKVAHDIGGKRSANSGAGVLKGDTFNQLWCLECKASMTSSFTLDRGLLAKTVSEARTRQKKPAISVMQIAGDPHVPKSLRIVAYFYLIPTTLRNPNHRATDLPLKHSIEQWIDLAERGKTFRFRLPPGVPECWKVTTPASARVRLSRT